MLFHCNLPNTKTAENLVWWAFERPSDFCSCSVNLEPIVKTFPALALIQTETFAEAKKIYDSFFSEYYPQLCQLCGKSISVSRCDFNLKQLQFIRSYTSKQNNNELCQSFKLLFSLQEYRQASTPTLGTFSENSWQYSVRSYYEQMLSTLARKKLLFVMGSYIHEIMTFSEVAMKSRPVIEQKLLDDPLLETHSECPHLGMHGVFAWWLVQLYHQHQSKQFAHASSTAFAFELPVKAKPKRKPKIRLNERARRKINNQLET